MLSKPASWAQFGHTKNFSPPPWDYNVAPITTQPNIRHNRDTAERQLVLLRQSLVPFSGKSLADLKVKSTINAFTDGITTGGGLNRSRSASAGHSHGASITADRRGLRVKNNSSLLARWGIGK